MRGLGLGVLAAGLLAALSCQSAQRTAGVGDGDERGSEQTALGENAGCYVCHMTFVKEPLTAWHVKKDITCARCHGPSAGHANDEDIGATPPDVVITHDQVKAFCRTCHKVSDKHPQKTFLGRVIRKGPEPGAVCTDCHGKHRIDDT